MIERPYFIQNTDYARNLSSALKLTRAGQLVQTHFSSGTKESFTLTLAFHFLALEPVCLSHSLSVCFLVPHEPHLQTTLQ